MYKKILFFAGLLVAAIVVGVSCSSDDNKYKSESPQFSEITLIDLNTGETNIRAGQPFVATAIQSSKGKLLNSTHYKWNVTNTDDVSHKYKSGVVYDQEPENPSDTIVIPNAGRYELVFSADYGVSGIATGKSYTESLTNGGSAMYKASSLKFKVTLTKSIIVH